MITLQGTNMSLLCKRSLLLFCVIQAHARKSVVPELFATFWDQVLRDFSYENYHHSVLSALVHRMKIENIATVEMFVNFIARYMLLFTVPFFAYIDFRLVNDSPTIPFEIQFTANFYEAVSLFYDDNVNAKNFLKNELTETMNRMRMQPVVQAGVIDLNILQTVLNNANKS